MTEILAQGAPWLGLALLAALVWKASIDIRAMNRRRVRSAVDPKRQAATQPDFPAVQVRFV
jgi:hypothetical protein